MLNCSSHLEWDARLRVIEGYVQLLVNSKHSFPLIKAIVLQALTKYKSMCMRSNLHESDKRFMPLYRPRSFSKGENIIKICGEINMVHQLETRRPIQE